MGEVGLQATSRPAAVFATLGFIGVFAVGAALWALGGGGGGPLGWVMRGMAVATWALGAAIAGVVRQGGLVLEREDPRMAAARAHAENEAASGKGGAAAGGAAATPAS
jgi:hypothetical protein